MKKNSPILFLLLIVLFGIDSFAQNLVPNASFEDGKDFCYPDDTPLDFFQYASYWMCPTAGTSDIFSTVISDTSCYSFQPHKGIRNHIGSQRPRTGKRFAGIITYQRSVISDSVYREYLQVQLQQPMVPGEYYCVEMYVSSADYTNLSSNNLGMFFSEDPTLTNTGTFFGILPYVPQIIEKKVIEDTTNWVRISGTFRATQSCRFLTIGNFSNAYQTEIVAKANYAFHPYSLNRDQAYYFIDDISVERLVPQTTVITGKTTLCEGEVTTLEMKGFDDALWTTVEDTLKILYTGESFRASPDSTTTYRVTARNCNVTVTDTVKVTVNKSLNVNLGKDTTICMGASLHLNAGFLEGSRYRWQDNSQDQYLTVSQAGKYSVRVTNPFNTCVGYDEITIATETIPTINLGRDTTVCNEFFPLKLQRTYTSYRWSTGSAEPVLKPTEAGTYWVVVENQCGVATDSINIYTAKDFFAPNVVTLNDDVLNNDFRLVLLDQNKQFNFGVPIEGSFEVFDRWGNKIYSEKKYVQGWPRKSTDISAGIYYFTFNYKDCLAYKGWIHVLR